jgi:hypothetical protein
MFRPLDMAIFRFTVQYSVRKCLFLVGRGGARSHFTMYGWYKSQILAWSAAVVYMWCSSHGRLPARV